MRVPEAAARFLIGDHLRRVQFTPMGNRDMRLYQGFGLVWASWFIRETPRTYLHFFAFP